MRFYKPGIVLAILTFSALASQGVTYSITSDGSISNQFFSDWSVSQNTFASSSDGGTAFTPFTANFATDKTLTLAFSAPAGYQFNVNPITGKTSYFEIMFRTASAHSHPQLLTDSASLSFTGATGTAPTAFDYGNFASFFTGSSTFELALVAPIPGVLSFTGFSVSLDVPAGFNVSYSNQDIQGWFCVWAETFTADPGTWSSVTPVPEPGSVAILGLGMLGLFLRKSRK